MSETLRSRMAELGPLSLREYVGPLFRWENYDPDLYFDEYTSPPFWPKGTFVWLDSGWAQGRRPAFDGSERIVVDADPRAHLEFDAAGGTIGELAILTGTVKGLGAGRPSAIFGPNHAIWEGLRNELDEALS
jgi:hypothetical protein